MELRNLSGIYIRAEKPKNGTYNICFEDLDKEEQEKWLESLDKEALKRTALLLGEILKEIGEYYDIKRETPK